MARWKDKLFPKRSNKQKYNLLSYLQYLATGSFYKISDIKTNESAADIKTLIDVMRALAKDSQINTALSYYATDATTANAGGQIIWATSENKDVAEIINQLFKDWDLNSFARDHILELATIGNLYIPTSLMYKDTSSDDANSKKKVAIDNNTIADNDFNIIPSTKIPPENILHLWSKGEPRGYMFQPDLDTGWKSAEIEMLPEDAVIHFSLGGLLGDYTIDCYDKDNNVETLDILFADPLMDKAIQPTQTLSLLEDAVVLSSLSRTIKFINVECGDAIDETEVKATLQDIKNAIEQNMSINTNDGDVQSYVNPQSPNNIIYLPKVNNQDAISITDLNMQSNEEQDSKLLQYYMDKKLSVLGVPKEAMNFSSNEGLGGAGAVMSQRSALYANSLSRLMTAYIQGWTDAINKYFANRGYSGFIGQFELHMNPIITQQSTIQFERRDSALSQAQQLVDLFNSVGIKDSSKIASALSEILCEVFPKMGSDATSWDIDLSEAEGGIDSAEGI